MVAVSDRTGRVVKVRGHHYVKLKGGRLATFWDMLLHAERARTDLSRSVARAFDLAVAADSERAPDDVLRGYNMESLERFIDGIEEYVDAVRDAITKQRGTQSQEERIALLRNTKGRSEAEAAAYLRKADQLEDAMRRG